MRSTRSLPTRLLVVLGVATLSVVLVAGAASAHVTVSADNPTQGGFAKLTFRVPNETDGANTTRVAVFFPTDQPLASVSVQQLPGWSYQVKTHKLDQPISSDDGTVTEAVSEVVWTASSPASAIKPGEFEEFNVSGGPLPDASTMVFKALQTYSDGTVVRWIEPSAPGAPEPERPAPTLTLVAADTTSGHQGSDTATTTSSSDSSDSSDGRATTALVLSILALVLAVAAVALSVLRRSRS